MADVTDAEVPDSPTILTPDSMLSEPATLPILKTIDDHDSSEKMIASHDDHPNTPRISPATSTAKKGSQNSEKAIDLDHTTKCCGCDDGSEKSFVLDCEHVLCLGCIMANIAENNSCPRCSVKNFESTNVEDRTDIKEGASEDDSNHSPSNPDHGSSEDCSDKSSEASLKIADADGKAKIVADNTLCLAVLNFAFSAWIIGVGLLQFCSEVPVLLSSPLTFGPYEWLQFGVQCLILGISVNTFTGQLGLFAHWLWAKAKCQTNAHEKLNSTVQFLTTWSQTTFTTLKSHVLLLTLVIGKTWLYQFRSWFGIDTDVPDMFLELVFNLIQLLVHLMEIICHMSMLKERFNLNAPAQEPNEMLNEEPKEVSHEENPVSKSSSEEVNNVCDKMSTFVTRLQSHTQFYSPFVRWLDTPVTVSGWDYAKMNFIFVLHGVVLVRLCIPDLCPVNVIEGGILCSVLLKIPHDEGWVFGLFP